MRDMKLIKAGDLKRAIAEMRRPGETVFTDLTSVEGLIDCMPAADLESLRPTAQWQGEYDGYADGNPVYDVWSCSACGHCIDDGTDDPELLPKYCPNCGARMVNDDEDKK